MVARINADILLPNYELYIMRIHVRISLWVCLKRRRTHGGFLLKLEWPLKSICRLPVISHLLSNYPTIWNIGPDSNPPPMLQGCREIRHPFTTLNRRISIGFSDGGAAVLFYPGWLFPLSRDWSGFFVF